MFNKTSCHTCWSAIPGCLDCTKPNKCRLCADNYQMNDLTRKCDLKGGEGHTVLIVVLCVVAAVVVVGIVVAWRMVKKKRTKGKE